MPVAGGRAQKRVNECSSNHNLDTSSLHDSDATHRDALQEVAGWHMEDWEELEALLVAEHLILGEEQQQQQRSDVNLLQSPEHTPRPPPEAPSSRSSSRRSLPRTRGGFSVPLHQLSSILLNMTFSDAEDDHQGANRNTSNEQDRSLSRSRTESGVSNASTVSLASPSSSAGPAAAASNGPAASGGAAGEDIVAAAQNATMADMTGVDKKKVVEKLQQIQGYIQQTTAAMAALEQQGDIGLQNDIYARYVHLNKSLQHQEEEYLDILARSLVLNKAAAQVANGTQQSTAPSSSPLAQVNGGEEPVAEEGSRVVGVISSDNVRTLQDRLAASQEESVAIVSQMRASIARREGLLTRYKATQERLANLKKQRKGIHDEKQRLLQQGTATGDTPLEEDEDPIPGSENWPLAEVTRALVDFQALHDKVVRLTSVYTTRAQDMAADDEEGKTDVANKLSLLASRRRQLSDALTRLRGYQALRQQEERDALEGEEGGGRTGSGTPARAPDTNHIPASNTHTGRGDDATPPSTLAASVPSVNGEASASVGSQASVRAAAESVSHASEELSSRKAQLSSLQKQLSDMKKMLDVANMANLARQEDIEGACSLPTASEELEGSVVGQPLEVSGKKIVLTEIERQNPEIASKYNQLSRAKERLAKMEDVIAMITEARQNGQNLRDVLPPDYLSILEEAEEEFSGPSRPTPQRSVEIEEDMGRLSRRPTRPPRTASASRSEAGPGLGRDSQESREISAMQQRLNKTSTRVSAVNERSRHGHEKGAIKKQPQVLWQGSNGGDSSRGGRGGEDPRLSQVLALQEELRQKKNALEALMRRMGKSSSLNMDNISDNISDNVSETSDHLREAQGSSGAATWGEAGGPHHFSDNHYQQSSDEDLIEEDEADLPPRSQSRPQQPTPAAVSPKDRNRHSASHHRRRQDSGRLSVNNLSATLPAPTRTKHNRLRSSSAPKALWESVGTPEGANYKSPSNTTMQTQHSLNTALSQLNQVQGTINILQESLRQEQSHVLGGSRTPHYHSQLGPPLLPDLTPTSLPPVAPPSQALTPMSAYAGLGSLALAAQGGGETINQQLLAGMQQCFSQLHLHSLEIQALSKHLQLLERREQTGSAAMPDVGEGLCQGGRAGAGRSEEEEEDEDNEEEDVHGGAQPPYPHHHNLLATPGLHPGKDGGAGRSPQDSFSVFLRQQSEGGEIPSSGVTNPIYGHLGDLRDQAGSTWGSLAPTPGTEQPTDTLGSLLEAAAGVGTLEGSPSHPLLHLSRLGEESSQSQAPEAHHWASLASTHPLHHQTTDLLNNQVPPGTRANNYWDNFRSYSRQNLLSTTTKSNTSDIHPPSTTSISVPAHTAASTLHHGREGVRGEDKRFNVSVGHNNTNCGAGARARMPNPHINNPRGAANPRVRNPVAPNSKHLLSQNKHKANNRNKQTGDIWTATKGSERNLPPQDRGSGGRNAGYLNYNSARANTSDSDGGGDGNNSVGVTLEVLREAESLIRRHANQPEFLLQLFRHASKITVHTDQHVAVALLHDLASQPHRPSSHGVNANARGSSRRRTEGAASLTLPQPLRGSWRSQPPHRHPQNTLPQENVSVVGLSGSEVSDSGLTSEDEDNRALYRNMKNLSLSPGGAAAPQTPAGEVNTSARPQYPQPTPLHPGPHYDHNYHGFPPHGHHNLSNPPTTQGGESTRSVANSESSLYDHLVFNDSHLASRQEVVEDWVRRGVEDEEGPRKLLNQPDTAGSSPEDAHNLIHPLNNDTEYLTFETLVASAVRESTEVLQAQECEDVASPLLLNSLHHSLVAHIQTRAQSLRLPQSFLFSTDTELKSALQSFTGKPLAQVSSDVPSIISQVLLTQYCSVLVQRLRDNRPLLPQTPTKLPTTSLTKPAEMGLEGSNATSTATLPECHPIQEATTATQTEAAVFSIHPQRPILHAGHNFSLTSGAAAIHPPPPPPMPETTPVESVWQAPPPPPAPLPSPNHNPGIGESLSESSAACGVGPHPVAQSGMWGAEGLASSTSPLGGSQGEAEQEDAMMDDLGEATLVHTLAEADQSQDAVEGDWGEDSQAEGIVQAETGGASCSSHPLPLSQHSGWLPARDAASQLEMEAEVEGLVESEAEAAALGGGHLIFLDQQSQELDEVPTKLQSPQGSSPTDTPDQPLPQHHNNHHHHHHHQQQRPHSPEGSEG